MNAQKPQPPHGVGHDARGDLEYRRAQGERRIREQHLHDVEPGAHLEQRVDAPDERHRQIEEKRDREVAADDARAHGTFRASQSRATVAMSSCATSASALSRRISASEILPASGASAAATSGWRASSAARTTGAASYGGK